MVMRAAKIKLKPHEVDLLRSGALSELTHPGSSSRWLHATSQHIDAATHALVYRPMGDIELESLRRTSQLPATQPYQALMEAEPGRTYAEKYLRGHKKVDSMPTTVVEFCCSRSLVTWLFTKFHKAEDGVLSTGLGTKAGNTLERFNSELATGAVSWRIVLVKRKAVK
eukprot:m.3125 g.3125  ORF g.3125 m.3125 type:complete len:168 (+) comp4530_c0_seq1:373-876(+)